MRLIYVFISKSFKTSSMYYYYLFNHYKSFFYGPMNKFKLSFIMIILFNIQFTFYVNLVTKKGCKLIFAWLNGTRNNQKIRRGLCLESV